MLVPGGVCTGWALASTAGASGMTISARNCQHNAQAHRGQRGDNPDDAHQAGIEPEVVGQARRKRRRSCDCGGCAPGTIPANDAFPVNAATGMPSSRIIPMPMSTAGQNSCQKVRHTTRGGSRQNCSAEQECPRRPGCRPRAGHDCLHDRPIRAGSRYALGHDRLICGMLDGFFRRHMAITR